MTAPPLLKTLETRRFLLQPLSRIAAFRLTYPWNHDPEILRNLFYSTETFGALRWYRKRVWANGRSKFSHAIRDKADGTAIGMHGVLLTPPRSASLIVVIHDRAWWGKAVVEEVRRMMVDYLFETDIVDRLCCEVSARNMPAVFNYKKLGFAHVGTLHRAKIDPLTGTLADRLIFELLRDDWAAARATA